MEKKSHTDAKGRVPLSAETVSRTLAYLSVLALKTRDGRQARHTDWHLRGFGSSGRGGTRTFASKRLEVHAVFGEGRDDGGK